MVEGTRSGTTDTTEGSDMEVTGLTDTTTEMEGGTDTGTGLAASIEGAGGTGTIPFAEEDIEGDTTTGTAEDTMSMDITEDTTTVVLDPQDAQGGFAATGHQAVQEEELLVTEPATTILAEEED